jgi:hypothetical protein
LLIPCRGRRQGCFSDCLGDLLRVDAVKRRASWITARIFSPPPDEPNM